MFSTTFSRAGDSGAGSDLQPKIYATAEEAEAARANERVQPVSPRKKEAYERIQRKQRAEAILGQFDLLMQYAVENGIVS